QNVRRAGEDLARGRPALRAGTRLLPAHLGLIASLGIGEVQVQRPPRVAFFSTGDELRSIGETLDSGQIYDSNRYTLYGMLRRLGVTVLDLGVVRDRPQALREAFQRASMDADVLVTSGGVSVGESDFVKDILDELGTVDFWKIAMKPGRPFAFGKLGDCAFFGLPGNPVAVMVTFYQFVQPALSHLAGQTPAPLTPVFKVRCESEIRKKPGRTEFYRAVLEPDASGTLIVRTTGAQGSGVLRSMAEANCFVILPPESGSVSPGALVDVQPFEGLV
ncbi:MAG: gephyrin-like molybdotransferase Glp, partial [Gammaproteobacteria bacterium]